MKKFAIIVVFALVSVAAFAKPQCQSFSNHDNKVTIIFMDDKVGEKYSVTDVKLIPTWIGKEYKATSVKANVKDGVATVTLTFQHLTQFTNPKVSLKINGKKATFKVCR